MLKNKLYLPFLCVFSTLGCHAQSGLKTTAVYMYTNGFAYVQANGNVKTTDAQWSLLQKDIPPAVQGSFWFYSPSGINYVSRNTDTILKPNLAPDAEALLRNNIGKKVTLHFVINTITRLEGEIVKVFGTAAFENKAYSNLNDAVALLKTDAGNVIVYRNLLHQLAYIGLGDNADYNVNAKSLEDRLTVHFKKNEADAQLSMVYAQQHAAWAPGYRLQLTGKTEGILSLSAEVSSGNWDLSGTDLNLVVGLPAFSSIVSRLHSNYADLTSTTYEDDIPAPIFKRESSAGAALVESDASVVVDASSSDDFYIYSIKNFDLPRNSHALVSIFEEKVSVSHTYECQLPGISAYMNINAFTLENAPKLPVYHHLKFNNPVKQPLVAATCLVENTKNKVTAALGQPNLPASAPGAKVDILLTQSLDLPVVHAETEVSRVSQAKAISVGSQTYYFDKVSSKAEMLLENTSDEEKTIILSRYIEGDMLNTTADWVLVKQKQQNYNPNTIYSVSWTIKLKAGEKKSVVYNYEFFQRIYY